MESWLEMSFPRSCTEMSAGGLELSCLALDEEAAIELLTHL